jgi:RNA polymerase sigma-70 factor, ECF subfamily
VNDLDWAHDARARFGNSSTISIDAASLLIVEARPLLRSIAAKLLASDLQAKFDASDVVQETYLRAARSLCRTEKRSRKEWLAWMKTLLHHSIIDACRAFKSTEKRSIFLESSEVAQDLTVSENFIDKLASAEEIAEMVKALSKLPLGVPRLLYWRYCEELTYAQIAERVGKTPDAVRVLVDRTRANLRRSMCCDDSNR